ncbi:Uncharacterised protein [uncultured archaeon]|nr:Uncharacterised protein [uncultured archaeon]
MANASVSCSSAQVTLAEPFSYVSNFTATPLGGAKISGMKTASLQNTTYLSFMLSPLAEGSSQQVAIGYHITDPTAALSEALSAAEYQVSFYNRTKDALALSQAKSLILQGRINEALAILSQMRQDAQSLSSSYADYSLYEQEKSAAEAEISSALSLEGDFTSANLSAAYAGLTALLTPYQTSLTSSSDEANSGNYGKALPIIRKGRSAYRTELSEMSYKSLLAAENEYAKARKAGRSAEELSQAESLLSSAQQLYSQPDHLQSYLQSSNALAVLSLLSNSALDAKADAAGQLAQLKAEFTAALAEASAAYDNYSSQYSSLSSQSRKQMPLTPSAAQSKISSAQAKFSSAEKLSDPLKALSGANESLQQLLSVRQSMQEALSGLQKSAYSSLQVAKVAVAEVKRKGAGGADSSAQLDSELSRAESFYTNALYADSLVASDGIIKAANALLSGSSQGIDAKTILLGAVSLIFIAAIAYYFLNSQKKRAPPEKKEMPKA